MQQPHAYRCGMAFGERQKIVGRALRQAREDAGLQQIELGRLIGKTQGYISKIENGHQGVDVLLLYDIALALKCKPADLYSEVTSTFNQIENRVIK